jgi:uncharacterized OB-fold protein
MTGLPVRPDIDSQPFWDGCAQGELLGQACGVCQRYRWPPREHCSYCHTAKREWRSVKRSGTVAGAVVLHRPFDQAFAELIPMMIAHVEIDGTDGQMVLIGNLEPAMPFVAAIGARVHV